MFCIYLRTNSDLCHLQHTLIGFYNRNEKCLQGGTDWVFKYSGLRFVFQGLRQFQLQDLCPFLFVARMIVYPSFVGSILKLYVRDSKMPVVMIRGIYGSFLNFHCAFED